MLFSQIVAFILVMAVGESYRPSAPELTPFQSLLASTALAAWVWVGCRLAVSWLLRRHQRGLAGAAAARRLIAYLHLAGLASQLFMLTALDLKANLAALPLGASETMSGLLVAALFFLHLGLVWSAAHPLERVVLGQSLPLGGYVAGQLRFVAPVAFPWLGMVLLRDGLVLAWPPAAAWLETSLGDLSFLVVMVLAMALLFPPLVRYWWGCRPLPAGPRRQLAQAVLDHAGVRVAEILYWPVLGGRMLTAGILGLAPSLSYLLITPALAEALTAQELAGVVAHEAGHARYRHLLSYMLFFLGFFLLAYALAEPMSLLANLSLYGLAQSGWGLSLLGGQGGGGQGWLSVLMGLPLVVVLLVYVRFVMGFFMRHFERQADFFALDLMGSPEPIAQALEKVALYSGGSRNAPSWHHFSIAQRVEALYAAARQPQAARRQGRVIKKGLVVYLLGMALVAGAGWGLQPLDLGKGLRQDILAKVLEDRLSQDPQGDPAAAQAHLVLGTLRFERGDETGALKELRLAQALAPQEPEVLNSLAWLLATAQDHGLRNPAEALALAHQAVAIKPEAHIWDTLAEAYALNQEPEKALAAARAAIAAGPRERPEYYQAQMERFQRLAALAQKEPRP